MDENGLDLPENMVEEASHIIPLTNEDGEEKEFEWLDYIEFEDEEYVVLLPVEDRNEDIEEPGEVVILKIENNEDDEIETYSGIEDEETLNSVFEIFKNKFKDEFNFESEE